MYYLGRFPAWTSSSDNYSERSSSDDSENMMSPTLFKRSKDLHHGTKVHRFSSELDIHLDIESDGSSDGATTSASTCVPRKLVDFISPLLRGSRKASPSSPRPSPAACDLEAAEAHRHRQPQPSSSKQPAAQFCGRAAERPPAADANNKHGFAGFAASASQAGASSTTPLPMFVYPELNRLFEAARNCALPPSRTQPEPGTPNYPTEMLALAALLPPCMQRPSWCLADYTVLEKLYKGYASSVYKALCKSSGNVVVLKVYTLGAVCDLYKFQIYREVQLHSSVQHENIVTMHAAFQEGDKVVMVQEYADGADLFTVLHKYGGRLSERLAVQLVLDPFLRVLHYLHSQGIIHRDIKPENIMFTKGMVLKLGDFGLAIDLKQEKAVTRAGTLDYMAPEVLRCPFKSRPEENKEKAGLRYSGRVDSWAVGVLTYELLAGYPPFYDQSRTGTEDQIRNSMPAFPPGITDEARSFINASLSKTPCARLTIQDMLHHGWIDAYRRNRSTRHLPDVAPAPVGRSSAHAECAGYGPAQPPPHPFVAAQAQVASIAEAAATAAAAATLMEQQQEQARQQQQQQQQSQLHHQHQHQRHNAAALGIQFNLSSILSAMSPEGGNSPHAQQQQQQQAAMAESLLLHQAQGMGSPKTRLSVALSQAASAEGLGSVIMNVSSGELHVQHYAAGLKGPASMPLLASGGACVGSADCAPAIQSMVRTASAAAARC